MSEHAAHLDSTARALDWEDVTACSAAALALLRDPDCTLATASYLFWAADPSACRARDLVDDDPAPTPWAVVREVVAGVDAGRFGSGLAYDPASEWEISADPVPAVLLEATEGAEPVVWRTRDEVWSWWHDRLEAEIEQCTDAEELFGIATHLDAPDPLRLVLASAHLDAGTALLTYWRSRRAALVLTDAVPLAQEAAALVRSGGLPSVVRYDPVADEDNRDLVARPRWSVPEALLGPTC